MAINKTFDSGQSGGGVMGGINKLKNIVGAAGAIGSGNLAGFATVAAESNPDSAAGKILGLGKQVFGAANGGASSFVDSAKNVAEGIGDSFKEPEIGSSMKDDAVSRRIGLMGSDPHQAMDLGAVALDHPDLPEELRSAYHEPIIRAHMASQKQRGIQWE